MNDVGARGVSTQGGFHAEYRTVEKSVWRRVKTNRGVDRIFETVWEAEAMAWRALKEHFLPLIRSDGYRVPNARDKAEKAFGSIWTKHGAVPVERK